MLKKLYTVAEKIGYPSHTQGSAGGGGKGDS